MKINLNLSPEFVITATKSFAISNLFKNKSRNIGCFLFWDKQESNIKFLLSYTNHKNIGYSNKTISFFQNSLFYLLYHILNDKVHLVILSSVQWFVLFVHNSLKSE